MKAAPQVFMMLCLLTAFVYAGPSFSSVLGGSGQDYATAVTSDSAGNVYVAGLTWSSDFPVTAGVVQTKFGGTSDAFIAKLGPDGTVIWCTFLGGILDDWATGIALDAGGNVLVTGWTRSADFPLQNPIENTLQSGDNYDAFVAKLDPSGARLVYSTFLGGPGDDGAAGIAVDAGGNAYVAITVLSIVGFPGIQAGLDQSGIVLSGLNPQGGLIYSFFHRYGSAGGIAVDPAGNAYVIGTAYSTNPSAATQSFGAPGTAQALVFKISADGSQKIFETTISGSVRADGAAIAVTHAGEVYIAGSTSSADFPLAHPIQSSPGARPLWISSDAGMTWKPVNDLPFAQLATLVPDPISPATVYAATKDLGVFKSGDGGVTWTSANNGIARMSIQTLAIDPVHPGTLYAATAPTLTPTQSIVYKTTDGANHWTQIDSLPAQISQIAVDPQNSNIVYEVTGAIRKSTDGGATWSPVSFPGTVHFITLDPRVSGNIYAVSDMVFCGSMCTNNRSPYLYRSVDGGADWTQVALPQVPQAQVIADGSTNPATLYNGLSVHSIDGGVTWTPINPPPSAPLGSIPFAVDSSGTLYAAVSRQGNWVSHDHAQTWTPTGAFIPPWTAVSSGPSAYFIAGAAPGALYAITDQVATSGFVTKLSADGSSLIYSTYLRGHPSMESFNLYAAEPNEFTMQNWISAIAVDANGNVTVAGGTRATDFPQVLPTQTRNAGLADAFLAALSADGSQLTNSTYFGGSQDDGALAVALDSQGNAIFAGQTWSGDFPVPGGLKPPYGFGEAFVVKMGPAGPPVIGSVVNGADFQPGVSAGSWVTIQGTNLADTYPGRIWRSDEIIKGTLPTSLDGVAVTMGGKPAVVYYISPTQINVQAPASVAPGTVNVVVNNNGIASAPATVQLQAAAPAFFLYPKTSYAVTSRLPDYAPIADPSVVSGAIAAKPGDFVVLWGTGFGDTNPHVDAGKIVTGAPATLTLPAVTVGGTAASVVNALLTAGSVGLYQVTIRLPAALPPGPEALDASVGGVQTHAGALVFVGPP